MGGLDKAPVPVHSQTMRAGFIILLNLVVMKSIAIADETLPALKATEEYLKRTPKDATYRNDAITLRAALKANAQH